MEVRSEQTALFQSSLETLLDQLEAAAGPDVQSLELITASDEDLLLGGEVEVRDAMEVSRASQKQDTDPVGPPRHRDGEERALEAAGLLMVVQGDAEYEELVEEAIGMEVEVTPKSVCVSSPSSVNEKANYNEDECVVCDSDRWVVNGGLVEEVIEVTGERVVPKVGGVCDSRRSLGRRREVYVPPVTEWKDFADSQDILMEFSHHCNTSSERGGEGELSPDEEEEEIEVNVVEEEQVEMWREVRETAKDTNDEVEIAVEKEETNVIVDREEVVEETAEKQSKEVNEVDNRDGGTEETAGEELNVEEEDESTDGDETAESERGRDDESERGRDDESERDEEEVNVKIEVDLTDGDSEVNTKGETAEELIEITDEEPATEREKDVQVNTNTDQSVQVNTDTERGLEMSTDSQRNLETSVDTEGDVEESVEPGTDRTLDKEEEEERERETESAVMVCDSEKEKEERERKNNSPVTAGDMEKEVRETGTDSAVTVCGSEKEDERERENGSLMIVCDSEKKEEEDGSPVTAGDSEKEERERENECPVTVNDSEREERDVVTSGNMEKEEEEEEERERENESAVTARDMGKEEERERERERPVTACYMEEGEEREITEEEQKREEEGEEPLDVGTPEEMEVEQTENEPMTVVQFNSETCCIGAAVDREEEANPREEELSPAVCALPVDLPQKETEMAGVETEAEINRQTTVDNNRNLTALPTHPPLLSNPPQCHPELFLPPRRLYQRLPRMQPAFMLEVAELFLERETVILSKANWPLPSSSPGQAPSRGPSSPPENHHQLSEADKPAEKPGVGGQTERAQLVPDEEPPTIIPSSIPTETAVARSEPMVAAAVEPVASGACQSKRPQTVTAEREERETSVRPQPAKTTASRAEEASTMPRSESHQAQRSLVIDLREAERDFDDPAIDVVDLKEIARDPRTDVVKVVCLNETERKPELPSLHRPHRIEPEKTNVIDLSETEGEAEHRGRRESDHLVMYLLRTDEMAEVVDNSFFDHESQQEEPVGGEKRVTLCSPSSPHPSSPRSSGEHTIPETPSYRSRPLGKRKSCKLRDLTLIREETVQLKSPSPPEKLAERTRTRTSGGTAETPEIASGGSTEAQASPETDGFIQNQSTISSSLILQRNQQNLEDFISQMPLPMLEPVTGARNQRQRKRKRAPETWRESLPHCKSPLKRLLPYFISSVLAGQQIVECTTSVREKWLYIDGLLERTPMVSESTLEEAVIHDDEYEVEDEKEEEGEEFDDELPHLKRISRTANGEAVVNDDEYEEDEKEEEGENEQPQLKRTSRTANGCISSHQQQQVNLTHKIILSILLSLSFSPLPPLSCSLFLSL